MKKTLFVSVVATLLSVPAIAVQRCVALNNSTTCALAVPEDHASMWESSCTTGGQYVPIRGVFACATEYAEFGVAADSLTEGGDSGNCWCKIIGPAESKWVSVGQGTTESEVYGCVMKCAYDCARYMAESSVFRNALFSSLGKI